MKGIVIFVLSLLAISLTEAGRRNPQFDVFEIRENQRTNELQVKPVKLQDDLESREKEEEYQSLINKLLKPMKKKRAKDFAGDIVKRLQVLKQQEAAKVAQSKSRANKKKSPIVLLVSPEYLDELGSRGDQTRTQDQPKLGSNVLFNIVPPNPVKKISKQEKLRTILRDGQFGDDRTEPPRIGQRVYYDDNNLYDNRS